MMAGPTTQASSAIGAVTEAQMARILIKEYCVELGVLSSCAGSDCVFVISPLSNGLHVPHIASWAGNRVVGYAVRLMPVSSRRGMCTRLGARTVLLWPIVRCCR